MLSNRLIVLRTVAESVALGRAFRQPRPGLRILMYHSVGQRALGDDKGVFSVSPQRFRSHVQLLSGLRHCGVVPLRPLDLPEDALQVAVTFDDGYRDNLLVAAPVLMEHGIPFAVFVSTDHVRQHAEGFLAPEELRELAGVPGATIGAHGKTHRPLTACNDEDLEEELGGSKRYLEDLLGRSVTTVAYPYGAADIRVRDAARRLGYDLGVCTRFDINRPGRDPLLLCRCNIERDDTLRVIRQKLRGDWDWYRWRTPDPLLRKSPREI